MQTEIVRQLIVLRPAVLVVVGVSVLAYLILLPIVGRMTAQGEHTRLAGLFIGMGLRSMLHMSIGWIKFVFFSAVLLLADPAEPVHYLFLAALVLVACCCSPGIGAVFTEIFGGMLPVAGLWVSSRLLEYVRQVRYDRMIYASYWLLAVFLIFCAAAVFFKEINYVSSERKHYEPTGEIE